MRADIHELLLSWSECCAGTGGAPGCAGIRFDTAPAKLGSRRVIYNELGRHIAADTARGVETRVMRKETSRISDAVMMVDRAVAQLPEREKRAVKLYYFEGGLPLAVRAKKMGVTDRTARRWLESAHNLLGEALGLRAVA